MPIYGNYADADFLPLLDSSFSHNSLPSYIPRDSCSPRCRIRVCSTENIKNKDHRCIYLETWSTAELESYNTARAFPRVSRENRVNTHQSAIFETSRVHQPQISAIYSL